MEAGMSAKELFFAVVKLLGLMTQKLRKSSQIDRKRHRHSDKFRRRLKGLMSDFKKGD
jgi:hypothetical protein